MGLFVVKKVQYRLDKWVLEALADIDATSIRRDAPGKKVAEKGEDSKNDDTETETCSACVSTHTIIGRSQQQNRGFNQAAEMHMIGEPTCSMGFC